MTAWPLVPLREVLTKSEEWVKLDPLATITQVRVKWWGQGAVARRTATAGELGSDKWLAIRANQFVISRIDARKGASGIVPPSLDGAFVSNDFPAFNADAKRLYPQFLDWYSKTSRFIDDCTAASEGTTNRVRLKEDRFYGIVIPLPPIEEQRRIVSRIGDLCQRIVRMEALEASIAGEPENLLAAEEMRVWPNDALANARTLNDVTVYLSRGRQSEQGKSEHYLIKTQHVQDRRYLPSRMTLAPHVASKVGPDALVQPGDILIACSAAGCLGRTAFFQDAGIVASTDTHVAIARANRDVVLPEYLYAYLRGAQGQFQLRSREKGDWQREKVGFRLTELNVADMRRVPVPIPGLQEQRKIVDFLERFILKIDALRNHQAKRAAEIAALRPSVLNSAFSGQL
jgi:type I restriction enzyme S subunit